jgi:2-dehydropantoate 2-reductase
VIAHTSQGHVINLGEIGPSGPSSERVERIQAALKAAGLNVRVPDDMRTALWDKFVFLVPFAALSTLARAPIGELLALPELAAMLEALLTEVTAVARAEGVDFGPDAVEQRMRWLRQLHPEFKSSMQRDLERGKRLEVDALTGIVVQLGAAHGIPTPVHACINAVLTLEDRRAQAAAASTKR